MVILKKYRNKTYGFEGSISIICYLKRSQTWKDVANDDRNNHVKNIQVIITKSDINSAIINYDYVVTNNFETFFVNVGIVLTKSIPPADNNTVNYIENT